MKKLRTLLVKTVIISLVISYFVMMQYNNVLAVEENLFGKTSNCFEFNASNLLSIYAQISTGNSAEVEHRCDISGKSETEAIPIRGVDSKVGDSVWDDGRINASDASLLLSLGVGMHTYNEGFKRDMNDIKTSISSKLEGISNEDIKVHITLTYPEIKEEELQIEKVTYEIIDTETPVSEVEKIDKQFEEYNKLVNEKFQMYGVQEILTLKAILKDGTEYSMTIPKTENNWYMVKTKGPQIIVQPEEEFETDLDYSAKVENVNVGGTINKDGVYEPNYDKNNPKKDADVTATVKSTTNLDIIKVNGIALKEDGTPNDLGWYYADVNNKKEISKVYPFDTYNNTEYNGMIAERITVESSSTEKLTSDEVVSIKWPFRIIEDVQNPETVTEGTTSVIRTVTTNLPIDKTKLPEGWNFTDDNEGKTQHRVYKEYKLTSGHVDEKPILTANGRTDTVNT